MANVSECLFMLVSQKESAIVMHDVCIVIAQAVSLAIVNACCCSVHAQSRDAAHVAPCLSMLPCLCHCLSHVCVCSVSS